MTPTTLQDVQKLLSENLSLNGIDFSNVDADAPLFANLGLDSLDAVELVIVLKKHYDIIIEDMKEGKEVFASLESLRRFIEQTRKK